MREGNSYTAEYWEYDARSGRRWNIDPIEYPWQGPYSTFNNNPVVFVDPDGRSQESHKYGKSGAGHSNIMLLIAPKKPKK